jgi:Putative peptidoglycan binding domain
VVADEDDFGFGAVAADETVESAPRTPRRFDPPPSGRLRALLRLVAVLAAAIAVIVGLVSVVSGSDQRARTRGYFQGLAAPAADSQAAGQELEQLLGGSTDGAAKLEANLGPLIKRQQQDAEHVLRLAPPPRLLALQQRANDVFALRLAGLQGLLSTLRTGTGAKDLLAAAQILAASEQRLVTSDVVWNDLVQTPLLAWAGHEHLAASLVPASTFGGNPDLVSTTQAEHLLQRLRGVSRNSRTPVAAVIKLGDRGSAVSVWQSQLNTWLKQASPNSTPLVPDGVFGPGTQAATQALQRSAGITPDGAVGPATRRALRTALGNHG